MTSQNNVLLVGGTGFLGYYAVQALLARGWGITAVGLPPEPPADLFPASVEIVLKNIDTASDEELLGLLTGHTALVYAAGMDDRILPKRPSYPNLYHANVEIPLRLFRLRSPTPKTSTQTMNGTSAARWIKPIQPIKVFWSCGAFDVMIKKRSVVASIIPKIRVHD